MPRPGHCFIAFAICLIAGLWVLYLKQEEKQWQLTNVTNHLPDLRFSMIADDGKPASAQNFRGDIVLLYFGYTGCPGECPATLAQLGQIEREWHEATPLQVLFASVAPAVDTPHVLHQYLASFSHVTGLTGSLDATEYLTRRYRAAYRPAPGNGEIAHSALVYVFDPQGHARLLIRPQDRDEATLGDLRRLAHESR